MARKQKVVSCWCRPLAITAISLGARANAQELTVGTIGASSDAPFFIADAKGYFAEQGLKVKFIRFDSAAKAIPSLVRARSMSAPAPPRPASTTPMRAASASRSSPTRRARQGLRLPGDHGTEPT